MVSSKRIYRGLYYHKVNKYIGSCMVALSKELLRQPPAQRYGAGLRLVAIKHTWIIAEDNHGSRYFYDTAINPNDRRMDCTGRAEPIDTIMQRYAKRLFVLGEPI